MLEALKNRLVADARNWWKMRSVQLAAIAAALAAAVTANQGLALGLLGLLPNGPLRWLVAALVFAVVFVVPTLTRLWKQRDVGSGGAVQSAAGGDAPRQ